MKLKKRLAAQFNLQALDVFLIKALFFCWCVLVSLLPFKIFAEEVKVAVSANFTAPMKALAAEFEKETGHTSVLSFASSGKLYAQIVYGAPFEVFLSADQEKPEALIKDQKALPESRFTYALGTLALWSAKGPRINNSPEVLQSGHFNKLAIANPKLAPYGLAAIQVLTALNLTSDLEKKLVRGENILQTYQYVSTGNAELGFIALSQIVTNDKADMGSAWIVPKDLYQPIYQDAVLLNKGGNNPAALALLSFLQSPKAQNIIQKFGYGIKIE